MVLNNVNTYACILKAPPHSHSISLNKWNSTFNESSLILTQYEILAWILKAHSHSKSGGSICMSLPWVSMLFLNHDGFRNWYNRVKYICINSERLCRYSIFFDTSVYATDTFQLECGNLCKFPCTAIVESRVIKCRNTLDFVHGICCEELNSVTSLCEYNWPHRYV
jgi:hypothetical protein